MIESQPSKKIYLIVEGQGDVIAAPQLIRRILEEYLGQDTFRSIKGYNAKGKGNLTREDNLIGMLNTVLRLRDCDGCMVMLDADKDDLRRCPLSLVRQLTDFINKRTWPFPIVIVCAICEYASWFLYNLEAIAADVELSKTVYEGDPEVECAAKGWLERHMPSDTGYSETVHQKEFTQRIDLLLTAERSRSFRRLIHAVEELIEAIDNHTTLVSPTFTRA